MDIALCRYNFKLVVNIYDINIAISKVTVGLHFRVWSRAQATVGLVQVFAEIANVVDKRDLLDLKSIRV